MHAVDRTLKDILKGGERFGGVTVTFGGISILFRKFQFVTYD